MWAPARRHRHASERALIAGRRRERLEPAYGPCVSLRMRIVIAAVGRLKQGPERELAERYRKRALDAGRKLGLSAVDIVEIKESRARDAARRMLEESIAIANMIPDGAVTVILDERGENMSSGVLAA